jgi:hypothetical protein
MQCVQQCNARSAATAALQQLCWSLTQPRMQHMYMPTAQGFQTTLDRRRDKAAPAFQHRCTAAQKASTTGHTGQNHNQHQHTVSTLLHRYSPLDPFVFAHPIIDRPACLPHNAHPESNAAPAMHTNPAKRTPSAAANKKKKRTRTHPALQAPDVTSQHMQGTVVRYRSIHTYAVC